MTTLTLHRGCHTHATLAGPRADVEALAAASGLVARGCVDDRLAAVDHASDGVLVAAAWRAGHSVEATCARCEASKRGGCAAHRVAA